MLNPSQRKTMAHEQLLLSISHSSSVEENTDVHKLHHSDLFIHIGKFKVCNFTKCVKHTGVRILYNSCGNGQITPILELQHLFFAI